MELYNKKKINKMRKINETLKVIEPIHQNLWLLSFPNELDIPEYCVSKVSALKYSNTNGWKKITITINDLIGVNATKKLIEKFLYVPLKVELKKLNPTGVCVETINIFSKKININFGEFDYASDNLSKIKIKLTPTKVLVL